MLYFQHQPLPARTYNRIVSVVPSQTELLHALGLNDEVLGITKFCVHPNHWHRTKPRVGGTKNLHPGRIRSLQPDLVIANKEENLKEEIESLSGFTDVWVSEVDDLPQAVDMVLKTGALTGRLPAAEKLAAGIQAAFNEPPPAPLLPCVYLIWKDPYMTVGADTFINDMLERAGFRNLFNDRRRYPQTSLEEIARLQPAVILLSSEPYPFKEQHRAYIAAQCPHSEVLLADGEMFSWYGSRLLEAPAYFRRLRQSLST